MTTVWTNGCFDILHIGHIELFKYARSLGDRLIVGIDSDDRVRSLKGVSRPINKQEYRKQLLNSIKYIDSVVIFDSDAELKKNIQTFHIDIIVIGDDYKDRYVIGSELVKHTIFIPKILNISTTSILERVYLNELS
jgi:D-beta-D-heptose 7-phosphate kinase/D-beta-D-heptose 1-phosphate adenosyltransferase